MIRYRVCIGYLRTYLFANPDEAIDFATMAKKNAVDDNDEEFDTTVTIEVVKIETEKCKVQEEK